MVAALFTSAFLLAGFGGSASAQVQQDGLVNVNIGDVTITDTVDAAVSIVANVCPNVNVGSVAILAERIDAGDVRQATFCRAEGDRVTITNN